MFLSTELESSRESPRGHTIRYRHEFLLTADFLTDGRSSPFLGVSKYSTCFFLDCIKRNILTDVPEITLKCIIIRLDLINVGVLTTMR